MARGDHQSQSGANLGFVLNILYLGDGPIQGSAAYLYSVLTYLGSTVSHLPPGKRPTTKHFNQKTQLLILSDYSYSDFRPIEKNVIERLKKKTLAVLKVGGWSSFGKGDYGKSKLAQFLPVHVRSGDDRLNYSPGLRIVPKKKHKVTRELPFSRGSIICGLNTVKPKISSHVALEAKALTYTNSNKITVSKSGYPLLVLSPEKEARVACFMTDFAPHWAGGLVDWGKRRKTIRVPSKGVQVEVGESYIGLISNLTNWLVN